MIDLGTMNGWKEQPKEYTRHLAECGTERETIMSSTVNGVITRTPEIVRDYNMTRTNLGTCYNQHTCNECGITYRVDSGG